ncbi:aminopeptidase P N-terminal domain-containing protein [Bordetella hinzii]|uniref:Xaa-Pro aminopeptidase n=3 Tax=Bordetella hinzii TaxID=103855 RepID=A0AAN1RTT8_9BORD|nr:aminopeptidase P N-terminal domain-containing protein [Bordetella hinzii]AKQ54306.1 Xaa-Pro aminopeptidase [Bordetella hinzii]AKQ58820.1 Xaa-Pro aminopeptidase [Bordetella hinzii]AZW15902.1 peptidase M24 family protein [Bordetella hinzii]KCB26141.1 metallopeptidase family M24 [Bordetella hinzii OH87 BAL007II]KCB30718.1 metallopeptidase family M24 [Bordetella hinzii CA90 BAL1384]
MSLPADDLSPFAARRRRVLDWMQAQGGGVAVLATAPQAMRNRDADYPYRHDSDFYYLTGFIEPEAWLVLIAGASPRAVLFCRARNEAHEIWEGLRVGPEAAAARFGMDDAHPVDSLDELLPEWLLDQPSLWLSQTASEATNKRIQAWMQAARGLGRSGARPPSALRDLNPLLADMRLVKDAAEIASMRRAARISAGAHARAMRHVRPGMREYELEAELLHEFRRHGAQGVAYNSIVASGANACILHYQAGDAELRDGELVLIDAGCEYDSYASDITRTFPVNGRYSGAQRALYDLTAAAQEAAAAATAPGRSWDDGHQAALRVLAQGMLDEKLLRGSLDGVLESGAYTRFYMHRTGHWLGLDVHDVGDYRAAAPSPGAARPWRTLEPGMMLTIEPGIYVRRADDVPARFWDIGIRIEDDALVTETGCELITRGVPVDAREIEALMRE